MSQPANHWKLGMFIVVALVLGIGAGGYFGSRALAKKTVGFLTYFDEPVTGLEVGSAIKFRGVTMGQVSRIKVAHDFRHVEVGYELEVGALLQLGLIRESGNRHARIPSDLRAQLGSLGVTGVKYVQVDFFDPKQVQTVKVPFRIRGNYIPATSSTMKTLEDTVTRAADRLPELTDELVLLVKRVDALATSVAEQRLPERAGSTLEHADQTLQTIAAKLDQLQVRELSAEARGTLSHLDGSIGSANRILARIEGDKGILTSAQRATDSLGDATRDARELGAELSHTLREISGAAAAVHEFVGEMQRDPDMLLKGRAEARR